MTISIKTKALPTSSVENLRTAAVAIIIPTLNEVDNIEPLIASLDLALGSRRYELIFVDDWSTDGTAELVQSIGTRRANVRLIRRFGRKGLSSAVIEGMMSTNAEIVAVIDADRQHDERILPDLIDLVASGEADLAIGSRYMKDGSTGDWQAKRVAISQFATALARYFLPANDTDPMSGFFAISRDKVNVAVPFLSSTGFKILLDLITSSPAPLLIAERPYHFRQRVAGESKLDSAVAIDFLFLIVEKTFRRIAPPRLVMFGGVGLLGVAVHLSVLRFSLDVANASFATAQTAAVLTAIAFNFTLNNAITYRDRKLTGVRWFIGLLSFYVVCGFGALANVGVGIFVFSNNPRWWLAGIAGAMVGSIWNFAASSFVTWRKK